jgi:hypothetical protein
VAFGKSTHFKRRPHVMHKGWRPDLKHAEQRVEATGDGPDASCRPPKLLPQGRRRDSPMADGARPRPPTVGVAGGIPWPTELEPAAALATPLPQSSPEVAAVAVARTPSILAPSSTSSPMTTTQPPLQWLPTAGPALPSWRPSPMAKLAPPRLVAELGPVLVA